MDIDDDMPKQPAGSVRIGEDLSVLSIDELKTRITLLEGEIARIRAEMEGKQSSKAAADSFFKS